MKRNRKIRVAAITAIASAFSCALLGWALGIYINTTGSMPTGVWIKKSEPLYFAPGDAVIIKKDRLPCLMQNTGSVKRFLKKVVALPGDAVNYDIENGCLTINGLPLPETGILSKDASGAPVALRVKYPLTVPEGYIFVCSEHPRGYDSRYFGPVSMDAIEAKVRLLCRFCFK